MQMKKKYLILIGIIIVELVIFSTMTMIGKNKQNNLQVVANHNIGEQTQEDEIDVTGSVEELKMKIKQAKLEAEQYEQELQAKREEILKRRQALYAKEGGNSSTVTNNNSTTSNNNSNSSSNNGSNNSSNSNNTTNNENNQEATKDNVIKISQVIDGKKKELDYSNKIEDLGIPLINKYPNDPASRTVWDMQLYNNRIYIGSGNYDTNTGPVDVYYYDLTKEEFVKEGTLQDEQINRFVVIDDQLIITGTDPREGWEYGNYYVWDNDSWITKRTLIGGIHNFDLVKFHGKLFAGLGNDSDSSIVMSTDGGETFSYVYMYTAENEKLYFDPTSTHSQHRVYDLFEYNGKLYALCDIDDIYEYKEDKNIFLKMYESDRGTDSYKWDLKTKLVYNNKLVIVEKTAASLRYTDNLQSFTTILYDYKNSWPFDALVIDDELYVLCSTYLNEKEYIVSVHKTKDCVNWELVMYFNYEMKPSSFEYANGSLYFGMGTGYYGTEENSGRILKVKIK